MKLGIFSLVAVTLALASAVFAGNYKEFAAQGYRWVIVNGPYACNSEQDAERITNHHTDAAELEVLQSSLCYYLIPGTIVQVIKQNPSRGLSRMRIADVPRRLWTYTRFLSEHPVRDLYGVMETPESSGLLSPHATNVPPPRSDKSATRSQPNGIP